MIISSLWTAGSLGDNNLTINPPDGNHRAGFSMCSKQQKPYVELSTNRPVIVHAYGMLTIYRFVIAKPCKRLWQSVPFVIAREQCDRGNLFSPKGYLRILSRYALRMTDHLVIAKPCKRLRQSVPFYRKYGFLNPALKTTKTNPL